ncbi:hypothetical protein ACQP2X_10895 [Actinoplanes sp. CA-131856]
MKGRHPWVRTAAAIVGVTTAAIVVSWAANWRPETRPPDYVARPIHVDPSATQTFRNPVEDLAPYARLIDPVPLGGSVVVSGEPGRAALLQADPGPGPATFIVLVRNIGDQPVDGSFSSGGAGLTTDQRETFPLSGIRVLSSGTVSPTAIEPRAELLLELTFAAPTDVRPTQLALSLAFGQYHPSAQWDLPPVR